MEELASAGSDEGSTEELCADDFEEAEDVDVAEGSGKGKKVKKDTSWKVQNGGYVYLETEFRLNFLEGQRSLRLCHHTRTTHTHTHTHEGYHRLTLCPVSHGRKLQLLNLEVPAEPWIKERLQATGLGELATTGYTHLDPWLLSAYDTSSFHMPAGEITVTLDDVSCLLHLPIIGILPYRDTLSKADGIEVMVKLLGVPHAAATKHTKKTKGAHATSCLLTLLKGFLS